MKCSFPSSIVVRDYVRADERRARGFCTQEGDRACATPHPKPETPSRSVPVAASDGGDGG
jgi:hypothetical protein